MQRSEFRRKMKKVYPEKKIPFQSNEAQNAAIFKTDDSTFIFRNDVYSDAVYLEMNGHDTGRCIGVELA